MNNDSDFTKDRLVHLCKSGKFKPYQSGLCSQGCDSSSNLTVSSLCDVGNIITVDARNIIAQVIQEFLEEFKETDMDFITGVGCGSNRYHRYMKEKIDSILK